MTNTVDPLTEAEKADAYALQPDHPCSGCGHFESIHVNGGCNGIHVTGVPNSSYGADVPCRCVGFTSADAKVDAVMEAFRAGTDLVEREERLPTFDRWAQMEAMATRLARSPLMPDHIRNSRDPEADAMVILLAAHDLGLSATVAFQKLHVVKGRLGQSADLMRALIVREGHQFWCEVQYDENKRPTGATAFGIRREFPDRTLSASFTHADAVDAKLAAKDTYQQFGEDMYVARASARLARRDFADCLAGITYTPDELTIVQSSVVDAPEPDPAADEDAASIRDEIAGMADEVKAIVRERWKEARLGSLNPDGKMRPLAASEVNAAWVLLRAAERDAPAEAEIVTDANATPEAPPVPADAPPARDGRMLPSYATVPTEPVELPPCAEDAAEPAVVRGPVTEPGPGQLAGNASAGVLTEVEIAAEVKVMKVERIRDALTSAGLSTEGARSVLEQRLIAYRSSSDPF